jgi:hypothetical protein
MKRAIAAGPIAAYLGLVAGLVFAIRRLCDGLFFYSLDDPYIHLALARNIRAGHYGLNAGEYSAPSSSIVWPYLLAPFDRVAGFEIVPLWINVVCGVALLWILARTLRRDFGIEGGSGAVIGCLAVLTFNLAGITFTGMEHVLQALLSVVIVIGVLRLTNEHRLEWWLGPALVIAPLVRYEALALTVPTLLLMLLERRLRVRAVIVGGVVIASLLAFSAFLLSLGLEALPNSVMAKSATFSHSSAGRAGSALMHLFTNLQSNVLSLAGVLLTTLTVAAVAGFRRQRTEAGLRLTLWLLFAFAMHMLFGRNGWFERYEIYMVAPCALLALYAWRDLFHVSPVAWDRRQAAALAVVLVLSARYVRATALTPLAASNIYEQQYQMARFQHDYVDGPVAINDLGMVAFLNPDRYVLDLAGLASSEALRANRRGSSEWITRLTDRHKVGYAMIYDNWFPRKPCDWIKVADLSLGRRRTTASGAVVAFYAIGDQRAAPMLERLTLFGRTLPAGVKLTPHAPGQGPRAGCDQ